jgi:hypothetical protein
VFALCLWQKSGCDHWHLERDPGADVAICDNDSRGGVNKSSVKYIRGVW